MIYALVLLLLIACFIANDILLELKIKKLEKEIIAKELLIEAFAALDKAIKKLNDGFKEHELRINDIETERSSLPRDDGEPEPPEQPEYTCKDCKYYHPFDGIGFADAVKYFECEKTGHCFSKEQIGTCQLFEKKEDIDEDADEDVVYYYANNVRVDISSKAPHVVYKTDGLLPEEYANLVSKLYYSD